jgi:dephospho-CoA kinase
VIVLGLTGSIGMGKSTTAAMFRDAGAPVWDADATVHRLYAPGGAAVAPVEAAFPGVTKDGGVDRLSLSARLHAEPDGFRRLEAIVHPLVQADRQAFLAQAVAADEPVVVPGVESQHQSLVLPSVACVPRDESALDRPGETPHFQRTLAGYIQALAVRDFDRVIRPVEVQCVDRSRRYPLGVTQNLSVITISTTVVQCAAGTLIEIVASD